MGDMTYQHIAVRREGPVAVVTLLDGQVQEDRTVEGLRRDLHAAAAAEPCKKWVLDFHNVTYFNTGGIRPLLSLHRKLQEQGGRIVLCQVRDSLKEVLQVTRLINGPGAPFELVRDVGEAVGRLKNHVALLQEGVLIFTFTPPELHGDDLAADLSDELQTALAAHATDRIVLDFSRVKMITTTCMRPLLQLRTQLKERGGKVVFSNLSEQVAEIFEVTRLISPRADTPALFQAFPDNAAAVHALKR